MAGYFSDPDGDELTYAGASSNESVATVAMEGSTATISAIAAGDAVITVTASDGSASVSQGFRIDVPTGPKEATLVITRLLDADRQQISDPTGISGTIYAVLDVQSNDETWTEIGLTLNGETVTPLCRGTGGSSADAIAGPGLAAAGQVEIECALKTNAVVGECAGMPLMPKYGNGAYELSAFLTTDDDATREVVASQPISLNNHGFVAIAHVPGSQSEVGTHTKGLTFYGGPSVEGNVNTFHACPVAYDGTEVGTMQLGTMVTDTERPNPNPIADAARATFREGGSGSFYPIKEAPFTWMISTASSRNGNGGVENVPGETEHWIVNDGIITDPNGRDVTATFRVGGETAKLGPLHFDFKAPAITDGSEVVIAAANAASADWASTTEIYYRDSGGSTARRFRITEMSDMGVGHVYGTTSAIAVGDYSAGRNNDASPNTAFAALDGLENVTHISQLPEEDPKVDGIADGGGIDAYVAEVQSLADRLGNSTWLGGGRIRTATTFGVDRTPPVISRERPAEALVLKTNELLFEIEDPRLGTGEDGSQPMATVHAYAGDSRYWVTSRHYWTSRPSTAGGSVTVDIDPEGNTRFAREDTHVVYVRALDVAGNATSTSFTFVRDQTDPALTLSAVPNNFGATTAKSVSVTVAGTLSDATEIRRAFLSIHAGATCAEGDDALESSQVSGPVRRLDNGTNEIEFSEVFTVKQADDAGETSYCFYLKAEDDARDADDRAAPNVYSDQVSTFSVMWPAGPPPAPTYDLVFTGADDAALAMVSVDEGSTATYKVALSEEPTADVTVAITVAEANRAVYADLSDDELTFTPANYSTAQEVTITTLPDDDNAVPETFTLSHDASDGGYDDADADLPGTVNDDEVALMASLMSLGENDDTTMVTVSVATGVADPGAGDDSNPRTIEVTIGGTDPGEATLDTDFGLLAADKTTPITGAFNIVLAEGETSKDTMLYIVPTDDAVPDEEDEVIPVAGTMTGGTDLSAEDRESNLVADDEIDLTDDDPDVTITANVTSVAEDADATEVTVTVTASDRRNEDRTFTVAVAADPEARAAAVADFTVTIGPGELTGRGTFDLAPTDNTDDDGDATVTISIASVTPANKANGVAYTFGEAEIEIVDDDEAGN
ncbi:hypothetical protein [Candidatus Palauibacter sp.]|uniref:hypothetical protein n=1 Tax=Candidatus Palauibacter sp. TaxID=3101350 RepID=UPI003B02C0A9